MKVCTACGLVMRRTQNWGDDAGSVAIEYVCACGQRTPGNPEDVRMTGKVHGRGNVLQLYRDYIRVAPHDRTINRVKLDCPDCGLDYLCQLRLGKDEIIVWRCSCGYDSSKPGTKRPAKLEEPLGGGE